MSHVQRVDVYLDERTIKSADAIIEAGLAASRSGAARLALVQFAAIVAAPRAQPTS